MSNEKRQNDVFSQLMFNGRQRSADNSNNDSSSKKSDNSTSSNIVERFNNVNLDELFGHVDTLMSSYNELKPLYKKVTPFIDQFISTKKK